MTKATELQTRQDARRVQMLRELQSDLADMVASGDMTAEQANEWANSKADQWSAESVPFVDTCIEHAYGTAYRLPFQIRVF